MSTVPTAAETIAGLDENGNEAVPRVTTGAPNLLDPGLVARIAGTVSTGGLTDAELRALSAGAFHFQENQFLAAGGVLGFDSLGYVQCPAGAVAKVSAIPGSAAANNSRVDASFIVLEVG